VAALIEAQEDRETAQEYMDSAMKQAEMADRRASTLKRKNSQLIENVEKAKQDSREAKARARNSESLVSRLSEKVKVQRQLINDELSKALDALSEKEKVIFVCLLDLARIDSNHMAFNAFDIGQKSTNMMVSLLGILFLPAAGPAGSSSARIQCSQP
jgi:predicted RNase H-like nuclease (RuvC/YqgF family)